MKARPLAIGLAAAGALALLLRALPPGGPLATAALAVGLLLMAGGLAQRPFRSYSPGAIGAGLAALLIPQPALGGILDTLGTVAAAAALVAAGFLQRLHGRASLRAGATVPATLVRRILLTTGLAAAVVAAGLVALSLGAPLVSARWAASVDLHSGTFLGLLALLACAAVTGLVVLRLARPAKDA